MRRLMSLTLAAIVEGFTGDWIRVNGVEGAKVKVTARGTNSRTYKFAKKFNF
jgi:hypothetical protein